MTRPRTGRSIAIVGGGITGLAAAHRLHEIACDREIPIRVRLYESGDRLGGNIRTERVDGYLLEGGPDQIVGHKPAGIDLIRRLGLGDRLLPIEAGAAGTQVVRDGRPVPLPGGCTMMGPPRLLPLWGSSFLSWWGKARICCEPLIARRAGAPRDESLQSFVTRRFGREPFDRIFEPIIAGIFTADADRLSLEMTLPQLLQLERKHGSIVKALRRRRPGPAGGPATGCVSLAGGLGQLVRRIVSRLPAGWIRRSTRVERVRRDARTGDWTLTIAREPPQRADAVILACPAHVSARLLDRDAALALDLGRLEYASCATVNLAYPAAVIGRPLEGFGFFVGRSERLPILACNHVSNKYPDRVPAGHVLLRAFVGGARDPELLEVDDEALAERTHRTLADLLQLGAGPVFRRVHRFPGSMPQYPVGYRAVVRAIEEQVRSLPGLALAGGVLGAVGLPDCVATAETAAAASLGLTEDLEGGASRAAIGGGR